MEQFLLVLGDLQQHNKSQTFAKLTNYLNNWDWCHHLDKITVE
jgi:hypothetical protein